MGLIERMMGIVFGGGGNMIRETAQVFRPNSEASAQRTADYDQSAMSQFEAEFQFERKGWFDRFMDGLNRLPRPVLVISVLALFFAAMVDPIWFAERMQGLALVPEPLWWMMGVIVSFYFGARHQVKSQNFQKQITQTMANVPQVLENIKQLRALRHDDPGAADTGTDAGLTETALASSDNPAIDEWRADHEAKS